MCQDPPGRRLLRFAICSCGAYFPACDFEWFKQHATSVHAVNHKWVYVHPSWDGKWNGREKNETTPRLP